MVMAVINTDTTDVIINQLPAVSASSNSPVSLDAGSKFNSNYLLLPEIL